MDNIGYQQRTDECFSLSFNRRHAARRWQSNSEVTTAASCLRCNSSSIKTVIHVCYYQQVSPPHSLGWLFAVFMNSLENCCSIDGYRKVPGQQQPGESKQAAELANETVSEDAHRNNICLLKMKLQMIYSCDLSVIASFSLSMCFPFLYVPLSCTWTQLSCSDCKVYHSKLNFSARKKAKGLYLRERGRQKERR